MIKDQTIDEALIEIMRTKKALEALRKVRKGRMYCLRYGCNSYQVLVPRVHGAKCSECNEELYVHASEVKEHSAAKRASLDLTRKLADLRQDR